MAIGFALQGNPGTVEVSLCPAFYTVVLGPLCFMRVSQRCLA